jgi:hypothetical protein
MDAAGRSNALSRSSHPYRAFGLDRCSQPENHQRSAIAKCGRQVGGGRNMDPPATGDLSLENFSTRIAEEDTNRPSITSDRKKSALGSVVQYRCGACSFSSGELRLGWGKAGRASFWGGLFRCDPCGELTVSHIAARGNTNREPRCAKCGGLLAPLEGTSVTIPCPGCRRMLRHETVGTWD